MSAGFSVSQRSYENPFLDRFAADALRRVESGDVANADDAKLKGLQFNIKGVEDYKGTGHIWAKGFTVRPNPSWLTGWRLKDSNQETRKCFLIGVLDEFDIVGKTVRDAYSDYSMEQLLDMAEKLPPSVKSAMKLEDYRAYGRPLNMFQVKTVLTAVVELKDAKLNNPSTLPKVLDELVEDVDAKFEKTFGDYEEKFYPEDFQALKKLCADKIAECQKQLVNTAKEWCKTHIPEKATKEDYACLLADMAKILYEKGVKITGDDVSSCMLPKTNADLPNGLHLSLDDVKTSPGNPGSGPKLKITDEKIIEEKRMAIISHRENANDVYNGIKNLIYSKAVSSLMKAYPDVFVKMFGVSRPAFDAAVRMIQSGKFPDLQDPDFVNKYEGDRIKGRETIALWNSLVYGIQELQRTIVRILKD